MVLFSVEIARTYVKHVVMLKYINRSARISLQLIFWCKSFICYIRVFVHLQLSTELYYKAGLV